MSARPAEIDLVDISENLQQLAVQTLQRTGVPGVSLAVSVGGRRAGASAGTVACGGDVPMARGARFTLGCITKMLTSLVALDLVEDGRLTLDAPLREYLPELCAQSDKGERIKIRHLGSHTSGYEGINPAGVEHAYFYSWNKFAEFFPRMPQVFEPGSVFNYEHTESVLLGEVIRKITGRSAQELARETILDPLGIDIGSSLQDAKQPEFRVADHSYDPAKRGFQVVRSVPYCAFWQDSLADISASTHDLATFGELMAGSRRIAGLSDGVISGLRHQIVSLPSTSGGPSREAVPHSFGFGCAEYGPSWLGHNGSGRGQTCGLRFDPIDNIVVVVAMNAWLPHERDRLLETVLRMLRPGKAQTERASGRVPVPLVEDIEGTYVGCVPGVRVIVTRFDDQFHCLVSGAGGANKSNLRLVMVRNATGDLVLKSDAMHFSIGVLRDEATGQPCFMLGLNAFKRVAEVAAA